MFAVIVILVQCVIISSIVDANKKVVFKIEVPNHVKHQHHTKIVYLHKYHEPPHHVHHNHDHHHDHHHGHHHHHHPHHHHHVNHHGHGHGHHVPHHHKPHHHPPHKKPKKPTVVHKKPHAYHHYNYGHNHHFTSSHHNHHGPHHPIMKHKQDYQVNPGHGQYKGGSYLNSPGLSSGFHTRVNFGRLVEPEDVEVKRYKTKPNLSSNFHTAVNYERLVEPDDTEKLQKQKIEPVSGNDFDVENIADDPKSGNYQNEKEEVQEDPVTHTYEVKEDHPHDFGADIKHYDREYDHFKSEQYPFTESEGYSYSEDDTHPFSIAKYTSNIRHGDIDLEETNYGPSHGSEIEKYISEFKDSNSDFDH